MFLKHTHFQTILAKAFLLHRISESFRREPPDPHFQEGKGKRGMEKGKGLEKGERKGKGNARKKQMGRKALP